MAAKAHLRNHKAAFAAIVKTQQHRAKVLGIDRPGFISLRKNRLAVEVNGSRCSLAWDQEVPQRLWIGHREQPDRRLSLIKMPHHILKGVRPALNMAAGIMGAVSDLRPQQAGVIPAAILRAGRTPLRI
jgi:hypothetical protein